MYSVWTVYTLFIIVKIVSQSQQMRAKKKKYKTWTEKRGRGAQTHTLGDNLCPHFHVFQFTFSTFFFCLHLLTLEDNFYCYEQCIHCSHTVHTLFTYLKILKMGLTILFTYLNIILLQCFQFSVFSFQQQ